jgi:hypothetical protein
VLVDLRRHARRQDHGWCWRSQVKMAEHIKVPRPLVNRVIRELGEAGLLIKRSRTGAHGGTASCEYLVAVERPFTAVEIAELTPPDGFRSRNAPSWDKQQHRSSQSQSRTTDTLCHQDNTPCHLDTERESPAKPDSRPSLSAADEKESQANIEQQKVVGDIVALDWQPSPEDIVWAGARRPDVDPVALTEAFVLGCRARGICYVDHSAAWRKWLLSERNPRYASPRHCHPSAPARTQQKLAPAEQQRNNEGGLGAALSAVLARRSGHAPAGMPG